MGGGGGVENYSKHPPDTLYRSVHTLGSQEHCGQVRNGVKRKHDESPEWSGGLDGENMGRPASWTDAWLKNMVGLRLQPKECRREGTNKRGKKSRRAQVC